MTFREYIDKGNSDIAGIAKALGMSAHGVRKWYYGQRTPSIRTALEIERLTGGMVKPESFADGSA